MSELESREMSSISSTAIQEIFPDFYDKMNLPENEEQRPLMKQAIEMEIM